MPTPSWFDQAAELLASGASIAETSRACGVRRETVSKAYNSTDSALRAEVEKRKAASAPPAPTAPPAAPPTDLTSKALAVLEQHLDGGDKLSIDAAKALLTHCEAPESTSPDAQEEDVLPADAVRELVSCLPTLAILVREHRGEISDSLLAELAMALLSAASDLDRIAHPERTEQPPCPAA
jgi:hypothetical protein